LLSKAIEPRSMAARSSCATGGVLIQTNDIDPMMRETSCSVARSWFRTASGAMPSLVAACPTLWPTPQLSTRASLRFNAASPTISLNNLSIWLSALGRREEALEALQEAVQVYRALAQRNPDAFQPDLAGSLNNLGIRLSELGRREEALGASHEAVQVYRTLAQRNPGAFQPNLAASLSNLGIWLSGLGRHEDAIDNFEEALNVIWPFFTHLPPAFMRNTRLLIRSLQESHEALQHPLSPLLSERIEEFMRLADLNRQTG
jgi:tetratricopeptide (TPR) repeat protein